MQLTITVIFAFLVFDFPQVISRAMPTSKTGKPATSKRHPEHRPTENPVIQDISRAIATHKGTGFYITCEIIERKTVPSHADCFMKCSRNATCRSFSFSFKTNQCWLNHLTKDECRRGKVAEEKVVYYEMMLA